MSIGLETSCSPSVSLVSGASSQIEFDVALSLESGQVGFHVCYHGHNVDSSAAQILTILAPKLVDHIGRTSGLIRNTSRWTVVSFASDGRSLG